MGHKVGKVLWGGWGEHLVGWKSDDGGDGVYGIGSIGAVAN